MSAAHLLVVDDSMAIRKMLQQALSAFSVETATTAADALERAGRRPPDLLLLDETLPDRTTADVLSALAAAPATATVRVVVLADRVNDAVRARFADRPAVVGVLGKAELHDPETVSAAIAAGLSARKPAAPMKIAATDRFRRTEEFAERLAAAPPAAGDLPVLHAVRGRRTAAEIAAAAGTAEPDAFAALRRCSR
jgi:CheY-like chemotaxis protein